MAGAAMPWRASRAWSGEALLGASVAGAAVRLVDHGLSEEVHRPAGCVVGEGAGHWQAAMSRGWVPAGGWSVPTKPVESGGWAPQRAKQLTLTGAEVRGLRHTKRGARYEHERDYESSWSRS